MFRKTLSMLLAGVLAVSMLPVSVFAQEAEEEMTSIEAVETVEASEDELALWDEVTGDMIVAEKVLEDEIPEEMRQQAAAMALEMASGAENEMIDNQDVGDRYFYEVESNNSWSTADRVYHDYTIVGQTNYGTDLDYYKFVLNSSSYVNVLGTSSRSGMGMLVYKSTNSSSAIGTSSFRYDSSEGLYVGGVYGTISSGTYYICILNTNQYTDTYMLYLNASGATGGSSGGSSTTTPGTPTISTSSSAAGVTVSWSSTTGASSYKVYRSSNGSSWSWLGGRDASGSGSYTDDTVQHGSSYYYAVSAVSSSGTEGSKSASKYVSYTIAAPTGLDADATDNSIELSWNTVSQAEKYAVHRSVNGGSYSLHGSTTRNTYSDTSVVDGKTYSYKVAVYNPGGSGYGAFSSVVSATYEAPYTGLPAPSNVDAEATDTSINVTWDGVAGASRYAVYRSVEGGDYTWVAGVYTNSYNDTKVVDGKTYSYKIACYNPDGSGAGKQSYAASATYIKPDYSLPAPGGVAAVQSGTSIQVTWNAVSGASRYAVYRSINGGAFNWVAGVYTNSYTDTKMTDGSTYSYKVACYNTNGSGCGDQSAAASATYKKPITKLPAPTGLTTESTEDGLKLTWNAVPKAERYAVYVSTNGRDYTWVSGPSTNSYVDTTIKNGETRFYTVACYNLGGGVGDQSGVAWGTYVAPEVELIVPAKPYKIANVVSGVHVYWKATKGADKYGLWRSETGKNGTYKWIANPTVPHFTDLKVESGKTYFYKVTSMDVQTNKHSDRSEAIGVIYTSTPDITSRENSTIGMKLGWQKIKGATGYAIYRKTYSGGDDWVRIATIQGADVLTWTDTSVADKNGEVFKYTIRALGGADMKTLSGCRAAGRTMARVSSIELGGANKAAADSVMTFWTKNDKATGYEIRFVDDGVVAKTEKVVGADSVVKTVTGLASGKTYDVQVRAYITVEGIGSFYSQWSGAKSVTL